MTEERFVGYFRLVEACAEPGCPVCWCVIRESRSHLGALLYEQVTDPDTRRAVRASWGFCNWHTWMLPEIEHGKFGSAIIYEDLVRVALEQTERLGDGAGVPRRRGWLATLLRRPRRSTTGRIHRERPACLACVTAAEAESRYLETLVRHIGDGDVLAAYARSDGLCVPHLFAAVETSGYRPEARALVARTREKWRQLRDELGSFVAKHDYRDRQPYTPPEAAAPTRAFGTLAGAKSVFGNDVHPRPRCPGP